MRALILVVLYFVSATIADDQIFRPSMLDGHVAKCVPTPTGCPTFFFNQNLTVNFPKPPIPTTKPSHMSDWIPDKHIVPEEDIVQTIVLTTTTCIPKVITSVITHKRPGPTPRINPIDKILPIPRPVPSGGWDHKNRSETAPFPPRFTGAASLTRPSYMLVILAFVGFGLL